MTSTGYPDYQRAAVHAAYALIEIDRSIEGYLTFDGGNVQSWPYVNFSAITPGGSDYYNVGFMWYSDATYTHLLFLQSIVIGPSAYSALQVPVAGPYLRLEIQPYAGLNPAVIFATCYGSLGRSSGFDLSLVQGPIRYDNSHYTAGLVQNFDVPRTYYGRAQLYVAPLSAAIQSVNMYFWDFPSGAYQPFFSVNATLGIPNVIPPISMPAAPTRVQITNGATAQSVFMSLGAIP